MPENVDWRQIDEDDDQDCEGEFSPNALPTENERQVSRE